MANTCCKFIKLRPDSSYDSEILRATSINALYDKLIQLNFTTLFAFALKRTEFSSLAKRNFFSRSLTGLSCVYTN